MVRGIEVFKEFFKEYNEQYVLIGGAACDIVFEERDRQFRVTKDLDIVLIVEVLTPDFGRRFWEFIAEGGYEHRMKSDGKPQFYRFDKPKESDFPYMIELFAKSEIMFDADAPTCIPLSFGDEISSLSAILLDDDYYRMLLDGRTVMSDIAVLSPVYLVLFKAKAWLALTSRRNQGLEVHENDIRKHKNDVVRLTALLTGEEVCVMPGSVREDMSRFIDAFKQIPVDPHALGLSYLSIPDILDRLEKVYLNRR